MKMYEINFITKNLGYSVKNSWEQTRTLAYFIAQTQNTNKLNIKELIKFSWDEDTKQNIKIDEKDVERLTKIAEEISKKNKI